MKSCFLSTARLGLKGQTGTFFYIVLHLQSVHSSKKKYHKKKFRPTDWTFFLPPGVQETIIHLRVASAWIALPDHTAPYHHAIWTPYPLPPPPLPSPPPRDYLGPKRIATAKQPRNPEALKLNLWFGPIKI